MPRRSLLRPLLRWSSLLGCAVLLAALGARGMHQKNFVLFLVAFAYVITHVARAHVPTVDLGAPY